MFVYIGIGVSLNIHTEIGLITLKGLISKHGILIVEFANTLQELGLGRRDAVRQAAVTRLRPIVMTTAAMVLGAVPLLAATGGSRPTGRWTIAVEPQSGAAAPSEASREVGQEADERKHHTTEGGSAMSKDDMELVRGSGNVFRDFGDPNAELEQARAWLAAKIIEVLDDRKLNMRAAEEATGIAASEFPRIRNVRLERFTIDRMITILGKLDQEVRVTLEGRPRPASQLTMV